MTKTSLKLDRNQSFGTVCGGAPGEGKFTQHGLYFDAEGMCITKSPNSLAAANALIDAEMNPEPDITPVRYAPCGQGFYNVYNAANEVIDAEVELSTAVTKVPQQFRDELGAQSRSDLIMRLNALGVAALRDEANFVLIDKLVKLTKIKGLSAVSVPLPPTASVPQAPAKKRKTAVKAARR